ncbi:tyrosine-type recombinase/integrase [Aeromonas caviae]|uniref:tyrosine-type recombinase/integrase n=1 Tax=Aeromonas caviae TaxID=648 RepID=UPI0038D16149
MANIQKITGKRGSSYRVQFMKNGRRIGQTFKTKKAAEAFMAQLIVYDDMADALTHSSLSTILIDSAITAFLDQYKGRDRSIIQRLGWWAEHLQGKPVGKVTRQHIKSALDVLTKGKKSPATLNRYKAAISSLFEWFNEQYNTKHNPAREVRQKAENNGRTRFLSDDELSRLLKAASVSKWERLHLLIHMAIATGARRSELINLKWSDLDFQSRTAHLPRTKNGSQRVLTLTVAVIQELMPFRQVGDVYLFPHTAALHGPFEHFDHHWKACRKEADITDFHFHDLRHTCASLLAKNGATLLEIANHLGHKTLAMVMRYAHLCVAHKAALTERVFGSIAIDRLSTICTRYPLKGGEEKGGATTDSLF